MTEVIKHPIRTQMNKTDLDLKVALEQLQEANATINKLTCEVENLRARVNVLETLAQHRETQINNQRFSFDPPSHATCSEVFS